ncbi:MAG: hypothetical protein U0625_13790 [Phycisphaerales bacterium]
MPALPLDIRWTVECTRGAPAPNAGRVFEAAVPGCVHLDLLRAGAIAHPDRGDGEARQEWVGLADWRWRGRFELAELPAAGALELVFESIDTCATVRCNGVLLGEVANQFHPHRFDARAALRVGTNEIEVEVAAPVGRVRALEQQWGPRPVNGDWTPYPFLRKSACNFGWDWGPRVPTSGLAGAVWIDAYEIARIAQVRPLVVECGEALARIEVHVQAERAPGAFAPLRAMVELESPDGRRFAAEAPLGLDGAGVVVVEVPSPMRWWPRGHGAQHLCDLRVRVVVDGARGALPVASWRRRIGLRTVALDTAADAHGSRFAVVVNGRAVPIVGANWIPATLFPSSDRAERVDRLLELACEAHLNMLRVWGGGHYEPERFYERCDELGLLVWQDFMFACATYPEDAPMPALVEAEARHQIARLSSHACLALWCGGNEDVLAWQSWGFRERLAPGQSWGWSYWSELLPRLCRELDPTRPYWTESPWSGSLERHANDPDHGDRHTWDLKIEQYRTMVPRFTSEFGHQGPPNRQTLAEALGEEALRIGSPELALRQRAWGGDAAQYEPYLAEHFHPARDFDEWLYQTQLLQARAMRIAIAWLRANQPRSMGALFWQWNDVWSGHSWSAVDVALRPKPFWHALRACAAPRAVSIEPMPDLRVALVNDTGEPWRATVRLARVGPDGRVRARGEDRVELPARGVDASIAVAAALGGASHGGAALAPDELLLAEVDAQRAWWSGARERERPQPPRAPAVEIALSGGGRRWTAQVRARGFVRELWIEPRAAWRRCEPNLLTLLPGEQERVEIELESPVGQAPALRVEGL